MDVDGDSGPADDERHEQAGDHGGPAPLIIFNQEVGDDQQADEDGHAGCRVARWEGVAVGFYQVADARACSFDKMLDDKVAAGGEKLADGQEEGGRAVLSPHKKGEGDHRDDQDRRGVAQVRKGPGKGDRTGALAGEAVDQSLVEAGDEARFFNDQKHPDQKDDAASDPCP